MDLETKEINISDEMAAFDKMSLKELHEWGDSSQANNVIISGALSFAATHNYSYNRTLQLCLFVLLRFYNNDQQRMVEKEIAEKEELTEIQELLLKKFAGGKFPGPEMSEGEDALTVLKRISKGEHLKEDARYALGRSTDMG